MRTPQMFSFLFAVLLLVGWEAIASTMSELVLPAPSVVFLVLWDGLKTGYFLPHIVRTVSEVLLGLLIGSILGITLGIVMGDIPFIRKSLHPYVRSEEHTSELQSRGHLVCRLLLAK